MDHTFNISNQSTTYSHGDDLIFKHILSFKIDSRPQFNDTITMIAKFILNYKQQIQIIGESKKIKLHIW